jgi:23S rRNA pseudouridine2457 synthase
VPCVLLFNKPYGVICRFSPDGLHPTLKDFVGVPDVYPAGRLDTDSEGLLILTDDGRLQHRISHPRSKMAKTYWVQVEGIPSDIALEKLRSGMALGNDVTRPAQVRIIPEPVDLWPRNPSIRFRKNIPTTWLEIMLTEGKNRQVRRMTAAAGHPTLRLIRATIGPWRLDGLSPGHWREENIDTGRNHDLETARRRRRTR